jgi:hypothetical protein
MSADILQFKEFVNSGRGLVARPILPNNISAFRADIATITYTVVNTNDSTSVAGSLDPNQVMYPSLQPWDKDKIGYTFLWGADGALWPVAGKQYRIIVVFTVVNPFPAYPLIAGKAFKLVWEADTIDPAVQ